jgi:hypothetical protein
MFKKSIKTMQANIYWFYSLAVIEWDKNATKATNVASRDRLVVASYYSFTIFPPSMVLRVMCYVCCSNNSSCHHLAIIVAFKSQSLKHTYP